MCMWVFLGIMSARKVVWADVPVYLKPVPAAEGGANTLPSDAAEKGANARPGPPLEGRYASGTAPDGFTNVKECTAEPAAAAEGDMQWNAKAAGCVAESSCSTLSMKNQLVKILHVCRAPPALMISLLYATYIIYVRKYAIKKCYLSY